MLLNDGSELGVFSVIALPHLCYRILYNFPLKPKPNVAPNGASLGTLTIIPFSEIIYKELCSRGPWRCAVSGVLSCIASGTLPSRPHDAPSPDPPKVFQRDLGMCGNCFMWKRGWVSRGHSSGCWKDTRGCSPQ